MITNRPHYSWSQQQLFLASKLSFYKKYVLGKEDRPNIRFEKGKEFGRYKETGEIPHWVEDPLLETVADLVPAYDLMEHKLLIDLFKDSEESAPAWNKPIIMYTDSVNEDFTHVLEYKTGKEPWTQQKVNEHEQLDFYAMLYYIHSGQTKIPDFTLYWIETEDIELPNGDTSVRYTGHVEAFDRSFSEQDILHMLKKTMNTMKTIYAWEYTEVELENDFVTRYADLVNRQDEIAKELNLMKLEVEAKMSEVDAKYAIGEAGKFSISQRKNYKYSPELTKLEKETKDDIKAKKKEEEKSGEAKLTISESIRFTRTLIK